MKKIQIKNTNIKKKINELKDDLSNEKNVRKELNKLYEDLKRDNNDLSFEFDGMKMINKIFKKKSQRKRRKNKRID